MIDSSYLTTNLVDIRHTSLGWIDAESDQLDQSIDELLKQVERARTNIGTGPPGRAD
jgi:hypothetical protein